MKASKSIHRVSAHRPVSLAGADLVIAAGGGEGHNEEIPHEEVVTETRTETKKETQQRPQVQEPAPRPVQPQPQPRRAYAYYGYYTPFCGTYVM